MKRQVIPDGTYSCIQAYHYYSQCCIPLSLSRLIYLHQNEVIIWIFVIISKSQYQKILDSFLVCLFLPSVSWGEAQSRCSTWRKTILTTVQKSLIGHLRGLKERKLVFTESQKSRKHKQELNLQGEGFYALAQIKKSKNKMTMHPRLSFQETLHSLLFF